MHLTLLMPLLLLTGPLDPPPAAPDDCLGAPLELSWHDVLLMGRTAEGFTRSRCQERLDSYALRAPSRVRRPLVAGRLRLGSFTVAGEEVGFGLDMVVGPEQAFHGRVAGRPAFVGLEEVRVTPQLYLPERWQQAIDTATYPVLIASSAAIVTWVLVEMLR